VAGAPAANRDPRVAASVMQNQPLPLRTRPDYTNRPMRQCPCPPTSVAAATLAVAVVLASAAAQAAEPVALGEPTRQAEVYHPDAAPPIGTQGRLALTGASLAVGWYAVNLGASYFWDKSPTARDWRVPVAGPWLRLGQTRCGPREGGCDSVVLVIRTAITMISSVAQAGGVGLMLESLFVPDAPAKAAFLRPLQPTKEATWTLSPLQFEAGGMGLGVGGHF
jgi:hypothetical protein